MFFYSKMRWDLKGMTFDELWKLEGEEVRQGIATLDAGFIQHLYKVTSEQYVICIGNVPSAEEGDRFAMGRLPMHEHLIFEDVFSLEEGFTIDVLDYLKTRRAQLKVDPKLLYYIQMAWDPRERQLDRLWNDAKEALRVLEAPKVLGLYRVSGQQRIIAIVDARVVEELDLFANLSSLKSPEVEKVWSLRDYHLFAEDVWNGYKI